MLWILLLLFLLFGNCDNVLSHIRTERLGYPYAAILVEVVLKECDEHSRRCNNGIVKSMREVLVSVLCLDSDTKTSCLCIAKI